MSLLEIEGLRRTFGSGTNAVPAVRGVDLTIDRGETVGLVGESGCGKTTLGRIVVGLQTADEGRISFDGQQLPGGHIPPPLRRRVQMVFQHPAQSLNPRMTVRATLAEPLRRLTDLSRDAIADKVDETLRLVGLGPSYANRRPRNLSGGQQQRVAIARALICDPELVVLDEPTSSLDQSVRARVVALLDDIQQQRGVAYLFISHDLSTVRQIAHRVSVMYLGRIVESGPTDELFEQPEHPYTKALLSAVPKLNGGEGRSRIVLPGETPNPSQLPAGCSFQDRCPQVMDRCRQEAPTLVASTAFREVECFAVAATEAVGGDPE